MILNQFLDFLLLKIRIAIAPNRLHFEFIELFTSILGMIVALSDLVHDEPEKITSYP
jgi:hypothetical protein